MPFVQRVVTPKYIARFTNASHSRGASPLPIQDYELEAITNLTLSNALRQLASLVLISNEIFTELNKELQNVSERSNRIKQRIETLGSRVEEYDPKSVTVPVSDLVAFVQIKNHYKTKYNVETSLFTADSRSDTLKQLYDAAAKTPVPVMAEMDRIIGQSDRRSSDAFMCTPILGQYRRKLRSNVDIEIETRLPSALDDLRKWTSSEAVGDVTVAPDCVARVCGNSSTISNTISTSPSFQPSTSTSADVTDDIIVVSNISRSTNYEDEAPLDHRLPSPEEQCQMIALKYPAETIRVDTSGRRFDRMSAARKSLLHFASVAVGGTPTGEEGEGSGGDTIKRRSRSRKPRGKRRNTIAGTDQKEIAEVANNGDTEAADTTPNNFDDLTLVPRSKSSDILKKDSPSSGDSIKATTRSSFNTLKQWGRNRLRMMNRDSKDKVHDIDDFNIIETRNSKKKTSEKDRKLSHDRKPSYSSSEKSLTLASSGTTSNLPASINPVKLRESSSLRRQRRTALGNKEEPHSSSGNWSASSESGRTSIGSEITTTTQPKSSASSTSLNNNHHPTSSGPPSSIISRRRFLNTSASSSITSEGTATPELQMYDYHDEGGETSSVYSCDTEGYYTSFHVDSGLKTLKEEEPPTPLHSTTALSSTTSFESSGNQTVISPENEYELFGKGSTSTTTSSAGTICTVLADNERNSVIGPAVPERKSSLTKLNRSNSTASNGTLERSYSSSTVGSTLERTGTIKRNGILLQKEVAALIHQEDTKTNRTESPDSGNNTSSSPVESNANSSPTHGVRSYSEFEYSESSDLECVDRIERIRVKTTINTSRIPSMCIITPTNSDDECAPKEKMPHPPEVKKETLHTFKRSTLMPLNNMFGKLKGVLKKSPNKDFSPSQIGAIPAKETIYDSAGDYVTIADVKNNNNNNNNTKSGVYYANDIVKRNLATVLSGNLNEETEYVSLNELPCNIRCESNLLSHSITSEGKKENAAEKHEVENEGENSSGCNGKRGARVKLDAHGKVIYSSDSLKRRKGAHTTFAPGPFVKDTNTTSTVTNVLSSTTVDNEKSPVIASPLLSGGVLNRKSIIVRPVVSQSQLKEVSRMAPIATIIPNNTIVQENNTMHSGVLKGAYVNVQDQTSTTSSSAIKDYQHLSRDELDSAISARMSQLSTYTSSTLPRRPIMTSQMDRPNDFTQTVPTRVETVPQNPIQRSSNVYWTLQTRKPMNKIGPSSNNINYDEFNLKTDKKQIEELYSTPNKIKKDLKTTPVGFATFFSPVGKVVEENANEDDESNLKISPIDPRSSFGSFKTSTPAKQTELPMSPGKTFITEELRSKLRLHDTGIRSHGNSPASSGRSTPKGIFEPQAPRGRHSWASNSTEIPQTCSDRLGTPKTSLMDFKKLLLAHGTKSTPSPAAKMSAVELLKKTKNAVAVAKPSATVSSDNSNLNILDLSGSPKTFATRRMIRQGNFGLSSPSKTISGNSKHMSPRAGWRYNNLRSEVMSTAIPEVNSEEDNSSPNTSNSASRSHSQSRNSSPIREVPEEFQDDPTAIELNIIEEKIINIRDNIFLKEDENNFMKGELPPQKPPVATTRAQLQAQRAQFFYSNTNTTNNNNNKSATFKNGHYTGISTTSQHTITTATPQPLSTTPNSGNFNSKLASNHQSAAPSLETAL